MRFGRSNRMFRQPKRTGTTKYQSTKQENRVAKEFGGKVTPGSGALAVKGDVQSNELHIECKTTSKTQYTLRLDTLSTLAHEASVSGKIPVLALELHNEAKGIDRNWVVIPERIFKDLVGENSE
jgi:Holliday junction resolvase